uniref:60S ribosomal protein L29 n=1 Tax=Corvus moneduloides TaxID=1196302 RepID=A0A8C3ENQ6_CORMO
MQLLNSYRNCNLINCLVFHIARKWHRNGIKKPKTHRYESLKGVSYPNDITGSFPPLEVKTGHFVFGEGGCDFICFVDVTIYRAFWK